MSILNYKTDTKQTKKMFYSQTNFCNGDIEGKYMP